MFLGNNDLLCLYFNSSNNVTLLTCYYRYILCVILRGVHGGFSKSLMEYNLYPLDIWTWSTCGCWTIICKNILYNLYRSSCTSPIWKKYLIYLRQLVLPDGNFDFYANFRLYIESWLYKDSFYISWSNFIPEELFQ